MRNLFKYIFTIFMVSGLIFITIIMFISINDLYLLLFQPLFVTSKLVYTVALQIFKISGMTALFTFPTILVNAFTRWYSERKSVKEGQEIVLFAGLPFALFLALMFEFLLKDAYQQAIILLILFVVGIIFGGKGNKHPLPSWWN